MDCSVSPPDSSTSPPDSSPSFFHRPEPGVFRKNQILAAVARALTGAPTPQGLAGRIVREVLDQGAISLVGVWSLRGEDLELEGMAVRDDLPPEVEDEIRENYRRPPLDSALPVAEAVRSGEAVRLERSDPRFNEADRAALDALGSRHVVALPVRADGEILGGGLVVSREEPLSRADETVICQALALLARLMDHLRLREEKLAASRRARTLVRAVDHLPQIVSVLSPDGTVRSVNPAVQEILGYSPEELVGEAGEILEWTDEEGGALPEERIRALAEEEGIWRGERTLRRRDGARVPVHTTMVPVPEGEGVLFSLVRIDRDLTEEKESQRKAMEAYRLAAVGELASGVAHEVNNPLTAISHLCELLLEDDLSGEVREDLEAIHGEARRAGNLLRNLLTFARPDSPDRECVPLADVLAPILRLTRAQIQAARIRLETDLTPSAPCALVDRNQIRQVFQNILTNARQAIQHHYDGGEIRIQVKVEGEEVLVVVEDTGPGIPEEVRSQLFNPFFSTKEIGEGTGLGLSISYTLIQEHGGGLEAENWGRPPVEGGAPGEGGARFVIRLPLAEPPARESVEVEEGLSAHPTVLIVEDEPVLGRAVERYLRRGGYEAVLCLRAEEALEELAGTGSVHGIVSDIRMPGLGGEGLFREVSENWPHLADRIIFTSGDIVNPATQEFLESTGCRALPKPYDLQELVDALEALGRDEDEASAVGSGTS